MANVYVLRLGRSLLTKIDQQEEPCKPSQLSKSVL